LVFFAHNLWQSIKESSRHIPEWSLISRNIARYNASSRFHELDLFERARSCRWIFMKCANRSSRSAPTYFNAKRQNAIDTCQSSNEMNRSVHVFLSLLSPQKLPFDGIQLFDPVLWSFLHCPSKVYFFRMSKPNFNNVRNAFAFHLCTIFSCNMRKISYSR